MNPNLENTDQKISTGVRFLAIISGAILLWLMGLTVVAVVSRKIFNAPIMGVQDLSEASLVVVVFAGMAYTGWTGGHIAVDLIGVVLKGWALRAIDIAVRLVCAVFFGVVAWQTVLRAIEAHEVGEATNLIFIPLHPFFWVIAFGSALFALVFVFQAIRSAFGLPDIKEE